MKKKFQRKAHLSRTVEILQRGAISKASEADGKQEPQEPRVEERTSGLTKRNEELQKEIAKRKMAEETLQKAREELERQLRARTAELARTQEELRKTVKHLSVHRRQLRSMASQHTITEEQARRKLAVYLHDNICQSLGVAKMKLDALMKSISPSNFAAPLEEVTQTIKSTIQDVRSVIVELSPPGLYELGFEAALEWLAEQFDERNGILCTFENDHLPKPLDDDVSILLFQSVRELLVDIIEHARARNAKIRALRENDKINIVIEDDGVGFKASEPSSPLMAASGSGFFNIRERLSSIGGYMEIKSRKGNGSHITLVVPLKRSEETTGEKL